MDTSPPSFKGQVAQSSEPSMLDLPPSYANATGSQEFQEREQHLPPELAIDQQLILPREPPATTLYQLSRRLDIRSTSIDLSRIRPNTAHSTTSSYVHDPHYQDQILYGLTRCPSFDGTAEVEITGKRRSTYPGKVVMKRGILFGVKIKHIHNGSKTLLYSCSIRCWPWEPIAYVWKNKMGEAMARSSGEKGGPFFRFLKDVDGAERDLLVACWCASTWAAIQFRLNAGLEP